MSSLSMISVTPVKGTALVHPASVELAPEGIVGNRRFHLADPDGRHVGSFDHGELVQVRTELGGDGVLRCSFPDGTVLEAHQDALGEATITHMDAHDTAGRLVQGPLAEAFSAFLGRPVHLVRADRDADGNDVEPVTLVSSGSIADVAARSGRTEETLDARRFRMNLQIDEVPPYEEDTWEGRQVQIGDVVLRVGGQVPRCRVTTHDPRTGVRDLPTLKTIASYRTLIGDRAGIPFGVYATVLRAGTVSLGDSVVPLSAL